MIELIATAESVEQAVELLATGVDTLYILEKKHSGCVCPYLLHEMNNARL